MKQWKLTVGFAVVLLNLFTLCFAAPFLVCDPQEGIDSYNIIENTVPLPIVVPAQADGSLKWDLASVTVGQHNISVSACSAVWGCTAAVPFVYARPALNTPVGIRLTP